MNNLNNLIPKPSAPPPFPYYIFPLPIRKFMEDASGAINCSIDYIGGGVLVAIAIAIGNESWIEIKKGWKEPAIIYLIIVGEPSSKKSPALFTAINPIVVIQRSLYVDYKKAKDDKESNGPPIYEAIITTDITIESLANLLVDNSHGLGVIKDEIIGVVNSLNQYRGGKGEDKQKFLSAWSGRPFYVNRVSKPPLQIDNPFICIVGGIQPDILPDLASSKTDGFIERFLFQKPDPIRYKHTDEEISDEVRDAYEKIILSIYNSQKNTTQKILKFSPEAQELWKQWHIAFCDSMNDNIPYYLLGMMGKLEAYTARFSLILEHLKCAYEGTEIMSISRESLEGAIKLSEYFKAHATLVLDSLTSSPLDKKIIKAFEWLKKQRSERPTKLTTVRRFYTNHAGGVKDAREAYDMLEEMKSRGICDLQRTGGKNDPVYIHLNPIYLTPLTPTQPAA